MTDETKVQDAAGTADKAKLAVAILVVIAGVAGYYVLAGRAAWLRWLPVAGSLVLAALVLAFSRYGSEFRQFVELARVELRKIVWPNRQETGMTTLVVFIFVVVAGIFFWLLDLGLAWATKLITGQGS
jgi:preprotein translocase subunit SecE